MNRARVAAIVLAAAGVGIAAFFVWWLVFRERPRLDGVVVPRAASEEPAELPEPAVVAARSEVTPKPVEPQAAPEDLEQPLAIGYLDANSDSNTVWPTLYGRIVSAADHLPLRDAAIERPRTILGERVPLDDTVAVTKTDSEGVFELDSTAEGYVFVASAPGFGAAPFDRQWLGSTREAPLEIPIDRAATMKAHVVDRVGAPIEDCAIRLIAQGAYAARPNDQSLGRILDLDVEMRRSTDASGVATFPSLPAGVPFDLSLWIRGKRRLHEVTKVVFEPNQELSKEWRLGGSATVTGRVIDQDDRAVVAQELWLMRRGHSLSSGAKRVLLNRGATDEVVKNVITNTEGRFEIADVADGPWWLGIATTDLQSIAPVAEAFEVPARQLRVEITLRVHRGFFIRGKVVDPDGKPASGFVRAGGVSEEFVGFAEALPSGDGTFVLGPLEPGDYEVVVEPHAFRDGAPLLASSLPQVVATGRDDIVLTLQRGGAIKPRAIRADTGVETKAGYCLVSASDPYLMHGTGRYEGENWSTDFRGLAPGTYDLAATTPDGLAGFVRGIVVQPGQSIGEVRVVVEPGAKLTLRYAGTDSEYAHVRLFVGTTCFGFDGIHHGTSATFVVPKGNVTVHWQAESEQFEEEVDLAVGETRELVWPRPK